jgi:ligand-binding SRPBCC domain-containing protein
MRVNVASALPAPAAQVWSLVKKSSTLVFVTKGFVGFSGSRQFPSEWQQGSSQSTRLLFFGFIPAWRHTLTFKCINEQQMSLYTNEGGGPVRVWNHAIQVVPSDDTSCIYNDDVEIKAGILTIFVWAYAQLFYRYRQLRWRSLLRKTGVTG